MMDAVKTGDLQMFVGRAAVEEQEWSLRVVFVAGCAVFGMAASTLYVCTTVKSKKAHAYEPLV